VSTLKDIEALTKRYAEAAGALSTAVCELEDAKTKLQREHLPAIKRLVARARDAKAALSGAIAESAELFQRPRTVTFHGVRVGLQKAKGRIEFDDAERVVALVRKLHPEQFDVLVKATYRPVKEALAQLPGADLKRLGITVVPSDSDEVFIKDASGEIDKLVEALLKDEAEEVEA
jgi:hypothetical protein